MQDSSSSTGESCLLPMRRRAVVAERSQGSVMAVSQQKSACRKARVEGGTQAILDEVEPQHEEDDGGARKDHEMRRYQHVVSARRQHGAPFRRRRLRAEAEEVEARCGQDRAA